MRRAEARVMMILTAMAFFYLGVFYAENPGTVWMKDYSAATQFVCSRMEADLKNVCQTAMQAAQIGKKILLEMISRPVS